MRQKQWNEEDLKRSNKYWTRIDNDLSSSPAFRALKYAPTVKVLIWFYGKARYEKHKRRRGIERWERIKEAEISFTYDEALFRGLSQKQFSRALKELCHFGFIDISHLGSGLQKDFSTFLLSERWRFYGTSQFMRKEFPKSVFYGYRRPPRWKNFILIKTDEGRLVIKKRGKESPNAPRKIIHRKRDFRNL